MKLRPRGFLFNSLLLLASVALALAGSLPTSHTVRSAGPDDPSNPTILVEQIGFDRNDSTLPRGKPDKTRPKIDSALSRLIDEYGSLGPSKALESAGEMSMMAREGAVLVVVEGVEGSAGLLGATLKSRGVSSQSASADMVQAFLPIESLEGIAALSEVKRIRRPYLPTVDVTSQGLNVINAPAWQGAGLNGSGVKVGIIDAGFSGYTSLLGSELPPSDRVQVRSFYNGGEYIDGGTVHGTAIAEIIYDIAPAAQFYLANINTDVDFGNAVDWMIANGVNIVSMSLGWAGANNYDGTGFLADKVNQAKAAGIFWSNSAGNQANRHWEGTFNDTDADGYHNFNGTVDEGNTITPTYGALIYGALTWDDSWGSPTADYGLILVRPDGSELTIDDDQSQGFPPSEIIVTYATQPGTYHFKIRRNSGTDRVLDLYTYRQDLEYRVASSSLMAPADAAGAMAVGAFYYGTGTIESFSSQGPTNDGRIKPDFAAPDGVSTYSYGPSFSGTSASAPHLAGAAALVKQAFLSYTPDQIRDYLKDRAVDVLPTGKDNVYGWGRLSLGNYPTLLSLGGTSLYFLADPQTTPSSQTVSVSNSGWGTMSWTASGSLDWLSLEPISGTAPSTIRVSVYTNTVSAGTTITGQIRIDGASGAANSPQYVNVTFFNSSAALPKVYLPMTTKAYSPSP